MERDNHQEGYALSESESKKGHVATFTKGSGWTPQEALRKGETSITAIDLITIMMQPIEDFSYLIVDCRYPYEYAAGHFAGAQNLYDLDKLHHYLSRTCIPPNKLILVFHCEYSTVRAVRLMNDFRNCDRLHNRRNELTYPYCFLLDEGFRGFWNSYHQLPHFFRPANAQYVELSDPRFAKEYAMYHRETSTHKRCNAGLNLHNTVSAPTALYPFPATAEAFLDADPDMPLPLMPANEAAVLPALPVRAVPPYHANPLETPDTDHLTADEPQGPEPSQSPSVPDSSFTAPIGRRTARHNRTPPTATVAPPPVPEPLANAEGADPSKQKDSQGSSESMMPLSDSSYSSHSYPTVYSSTSSFTSFQSDNSMTTPPSSPSLPDSLQTDSSLRESIALLENSITSLNLHFPLASAGLDPE